MSSALFGKFKISKINNQKKRFSEADKESGDTKAELKKTRKREKNGCFCCRKRRIKCVGSKPECDNCIKRQYICVWPTGNESLPHNTNFKITHKFLFESTISDVDIDKNSSLTHSFIDEPKPDTFKVSNIEHGTVPISHVDQTSKSSNSLESVHDELYRKALIEINSPIFNQLKSVLNFDSELSQIDVALLDGFVNGFVTSISPQLTHFKLQPINAFIPECMNYTVVHDMFYSCGASFLYCATNRTKMKMLSEKKFYSSTKQLQKMLDCDEIQGYENWLLIYLLLSYLNMRFIYYGQRTNTVRMLSIIEAVKVKLFYKQYYNKSTINQLATEKDYGLPLDESEDFTFDDLVERSCPDFETFKDEPFERLTSHLKTLTPNVNETDILKKGNYKTPLDLTSVDSEVFQIIEESRDDVIKSFIPYERTVLESFIFNYANSIYTSDRSLINEMTSPFILFDMVRPYLTVQIYRCPVPWMNHPVVGAAMISYELQAKVCWLGLFTPLSIQHRKLLENLRNSAKYYIRPILPSTVYASEPEDVQRKLMESCYAAEIIAKAVFIYSTKLLYPHKETNKEIIENTVEQAYEAFQKITASSHVHVVLGFSFAILGAASTRKKHRDYFYSKVEKLYSTFNIYSFSTIKKWYDTAWNNGPQGCLDYGWDLITDYNYIKDLVI